ncbi:uncharacterized protein LOC143465761 [Clavelina lepadiformis]|uniref:HCLS1-associated protein X-1 n=1 Tax=Clavelina lepadiformis TaxID=159417 RepID=A0ABP0F2Q8_CLALP
MGFGSLFDHLFHPHRGDNRDDDTFQSHWSGQSSFPDQHWFDDENENNENFDFHFQMDPFRDDDFFGLINKFMRKFHENADSFSSFQGNLNENIGDQRVQSYAGSKSLRDQILKPEFQHSNSNEPAPSAPRKDVTPYQPKMHTNFETVLEKFFNRSLYAPFLDKALPKVDQDLDSDIKKKGLDAVLKKHPEKSNENSSSVFTPDDKKLTRSYPFSNTRSMMQSRSMIRRSDGSMEERITRRDEHGNEETTIITQTPDGKRKTEIWNRDGQCQVLDNGEPQIISSYYPHSGIFRQVNSLLRDFFP